MDKTKSVLFAGKRKIESVRRPNIKYKDITIKQHLQGNISWVCFGRNFVWETYGYKIIEQNK